jgi:hypothetical protein
MSVRGSLRRIAPHCGTAMTKSANVTGFLSSPTCSTHISPAIPISTLFLIVLRHDTTDCSSLDPSVLSSTRYARCMHVDPALAIQQFTIHADCVKWNQNHRPSNDSMNLQKNVGHIETTTCLKHSMFCCTQTPTASDRLVPSRDANSDLAPT